MTSGATPVPSGRPVVVWGNCQAAPLAELLEPSLEAAGCSVLRVPPVFEATEDDLVRLREALPHAAALISQPVSDEYTTPGCGTRQLAALLPSDGRLIRFPVAFDTTAFPYQVNAHGGDGGRVEAPVTDYHDLRMLTAADRGWSVEQTLTCWQAADPDAVRTNAEGSRQELRRREQELDVVVGDLLGAGSMFTISHPTNAVLAAEARRILAALGLTDTEVAEPEREFLGERQAPVEAAVVAALGWPTAAVRPYWVVRGGEVDPVELTTAQLDFYADRPDVVADSRARHADRRALLGL